MRGKSLHFRLGKQVETFVRQNQRGLAEKVTIDYTDYNMSMWVGWFKKYRFVFLDRTFK